MDRRGVHDAVDIGADVLSGLADEDLRALLTEPVRQRGLVRVRAGDAESFVEQDFGKTAHTDAADPYEMQELRFAEINLIHIFLHFLADFRPAASSVLRERAEPVMTGAPLFYGAKSSVFTARAAIFLISIPQRRFFGRDGLHKK